MVEVKRIGILDRETYSCLFDYVVKWDGDLSGDNMSALIRSFFQFASEVDEGEVHKVKFSATQTVKSTRHNRNRSRTGPVLSAARKTGGNDEIYLQCWRGSKALLAIFLSYSSAEDNSDLLNKYMKLIHAAYSEAVDSGDMSTLTETFATITSQHFHNTSGHSKQQQQQQQQRHQQLSPA